MDAPKKNHFYALPSRGEQESSPDVVTSMLQVFCIDIYSLLELGATHFFPHIIQVGFLLGDLVTLPFCYLGLDTLSSRALGNLEGT